MVRATEANNVASPSAAEVTFEDEQERLLRQRELNRQRKARYDERQRAEKAQNEQESLPLPPPALPPGGNADSNARFQFKNPFQGGPDLTDVKLLTKAEAEDAQEKLEYLFIQGSSILDDILEIIVKDHEAVQIWKMDEEEAAMFATMQLEHSKKDKQAARVTHALLRVYERLAWFMYAGPRLKATYSHAQEHGGFSFR